MFKGILGFLQSNPKMVGLSVLIFIIGAVAVWLIIRWRSRKDSQYDEAGDDTAKDKAETKETATALPASANQPAVIAQEVKNTWPCKCGQSFPTEKDVRRHVYDLAVQEKGKHGILPQLKATSELPPTPTTPPKPEGISLKVGPKQPFRAIIWKYAGEGKESVIEFKQRISQEVGNIWYAEPSLPINGECYCVKELANGNYEPYDPRKSNLTANESPTKAYMATHWDRAEGVWLYIQSNIQKVSMFVVFGFIFITFVAVLIKLGSK